jgi:aspartyl protease family protein
MQQHQQEPEKQHPQKHIAGWMWFGFWFLLLGLLAVFFSNWLERERNPNQQVTTQIQQNGVREVILQRNRYGHYNVTGEINGYRVEFLLDTGATNISVPEHIAERIGLKRLYETQFYTANGIAKGYGTKIDRVGIGDITLNDLNASINPNVSDDIILLGMAFLKRIEFTQRGDTLVLRQYP